VTDVATVVEEDDIALAREAALVSARAASSDSELDAVVVPVYRRTLFTLVRHYASNERLLSCLELYLSERTYCLELEVLLSHFVTPLLKMMVAKRSGGLLGGAMSSIGGALASATGSGSGAGAAASTSTTSTQLLGRTVPPSLVLFLNSVQPLYTLSVELLNCLHAKLCMGEGVPEAEFQPPQSAPRGWHPQHTTMGELFLRYASLLELYAEFSQHHQQALALLTDPKEPFAKEVFAKLDQGVRGKMAEVIAERDRINEATRRRIKDWEREEAEQDVETGRKGPVGRVAVSSPPAAGSVLAGSPGAPTALQVESIDEESIDAAIRTARSSARSVSRMTLALAASSSPASAAAAANAALSSPIPASRMRGAAAGGGDGSVPPQLLEDPLPHTTLHALLTAPFMRVSKYVWLLSTLLKSTPEGHPDNLVAMPSSGTPVPHVAGSDGSPLLMLSQALRAVQHSLNSINTAILVGDNLALLTRLSERFVGSARELDLVSPTRLLVKHGVLARHTRSGVSNYYFHLFSDMLCYSSITVQGKFKLHRKLPLLTLQVLDTGNSGVAAPPPTGAEQGNVAIGATGYDLEIRSPQKSFVVTAKDAAERDAWLEEIQLAVQAEAKRHANSPAAAAAGGAAASGSQGAAAGAGQGAAGVPDSSAGGSSVRESVLLSPAGAASAAAPLWVKDSSTDTCPLCSKKFTLLFRRHHCRQCGSICCDPCSKHRRILPAIDAKEPVRVCDNCARGRHAAASITVSPLVSAVSPASSPAVDAKPRQSAVVVPAPSPAAASPPASSAVAAPAAAPAAPPVPPPKPQMAAVALGAPVASPPPSS